MASEKCISRISIVYFSRTSIRQRVEMFRDQGRCQRPAVRSRPHPAHPGLFGLRKMHLTDKYCLCWPYKCETSVWHFLETRGGVNPLRSGPAPTQRFRACLASEKCISRISIVYFCRTSIRQRVEMFRDQVRCRRPAVRSRPHPVHPRLVWPQKNASHG